MTTATLARSDAGILAGAERNLETRTGSLRAAWKNFRDYRSTLAELQDLTDRQLADVGMERDALKQVARRAIRED